MRITLMLRRRAPLPVPSPGHYLSREEFARRHGAGPEDVESVRRFAARHNLQVVDVHPGRRSMTLLGRVADVAQAFEANLQTATIDSHYFRLRTGELTIPADLEGIIGGVFGLDTRPQARAHFRTRPAIRARAAGDTSYNPPAVAALYRFPSAGNGAGQTIGIIELGGGYNDSDLTAFFSALNLPVPSVTSVSVDGGSNQPSGDPNSADGEVGLDIEVAGAIAPGASIVVYFAGNTSQGFLDAITTAIHDQAHNVNVISISWGGPEPTWTQQAMQSYDQAFQDAQALGVTICVAAGDNGSSDGETDGNAYVDFPASSPNVLACGGTRLAGSNGTIQSETVWNDGADGGATGGGVSETFPLPSYQTSAGVPVSVNASRFAGRGVPDVAGDADPATGYEITVDGQSIVVGGTSAVAPLWAALVALLNQQLGKPVGFLNPQIYAPAAQSGFRDITSGNNGAYSAASGWDACTGWGSPIGTALLAFLQK
ncbi:MAG TPA: S53 family peptidase [Bryobacteraceae bacterium]|nr:S53 family peptidase [Bryobacteraceae bacterium]